MARALNVVILEAILKFCVFIIKIGSICLYAPNYLLLYLTTSFVLMEKEKNGAFLMVLTFFPRWLIGTFVSLWPLIEVGGLATLLGYIAGWGFAGILTLVFGFILLCCAYVYGGSKFAKISFADQIMSQLGKYYLRTKDMQVQMVTVPFYLVVYGTYWRVAYIRDKLAKMGAGSRFFYLGGQTIVILLIDVPCYILATFPLISIYRTKPFLTDFRTSNPWDRIGAVAKHNWGLLCDLPAILCGLVASLSFYRIYFLYRDVRYRSEKRVDLRRRAAYHQLGLLLADILLALLSPLFIIFPFRIPKVIFNVKKVPEINYPADFGFRLDWRGEYYAGALSCIPDFVLMCLGLFLIPFNPVRAWLLVRDLKELSPADRRSRVLWAWVIMVPDYLAAICVVVTFVTFVRIGWLWKALVGAHKNGEVWWHHYCFVSLANLVIDLPLFVFTILLHVTLWRLKEVTWALRRTEVEGGERRHLVGRLWEIPAGRCRQQIGMLTVVWVLDVLTFPALVVTLASGLRSYWLWQDLRKCRAQPYPSERFYHGVVWLNCINLPIDVLVYFAAIPVFVTYPFRGARAVKQIRHAASGNDARDNLFGEVLMFYRDLLAAAVLALCTLSVVRAPRLWRQLRELHRRADEKASEVANGIAAEGETARPAAAQSSLFFDEWGDVALSYLPLLPVDFLLMLPTLLCVVLWRTVFFRRQWKDACYNLTGAWPIYRTVLLHASLILTLDVFGGVSTGLVFITVLQWSFLKKELKECLEKGTYIWHFKALYRLGMLLIDLPFLPSAVLVGISWRHKIFMRHLDKCSSGIQQIKCVIIQQIALLLDIVCVVPGLFLAVFRFKRFWKTLNEVPLIPTEDPYNVKFASRPHAVVFLQFWFLIIDGLFLLLRGFTYLTIFDRKYYKQLLREAKSPRERKKLLALQTAFLLLDFPAIVCLFLTTCSGYRGVILWKKMLNSRITDNKQNMIFREFRELMLDVVHMLLSILLLWRNLTVLRYSFGWSLGPLETFYKNRPTLFDAVLKAKTHKFRRASYDLDAFVLDAEDSIPSAPPGQDEAVVDSAPTAPGEGAEEGIPSAPAIPQEEEEDSSVDESSPLTKSLNKKISGPAVGLASKEIKEALTAVQRRALVRAQFFPFLYDLPLILGLVPMVVTLYRIPQLVRQTKRYHRGLSEHRMFLDEFINWVQDLAFMVLATLSLVSPIRWYPMLRAAVFEAKDSERRRVFRKCAMYVIPDYVCFAAVCLSLWRVPAFFKRVSLRRGGVGWNHWHREALLNILQTALDILCAAGLAVMFVTLHRIPIVLRAFKRHAADRQRRSMETATQPTQSWHGLVGDEFVQWIIDSVIILPGLLDLVAFWRIPRLAYICWKKHSDLPADNDEKRRALWSQQPLLILQDLGCFVLLVLLLLAPWRWGETVGGIKRDLTGWHACVWDVWKLEVYDYYCFVLILCMTVTGWRLPSLYTAVKERVKKQDDGHTIHRDWHAVVREQFSLWFGDIPAAFCALVGAVFVWRIAIMWIRSRPPAMLSEKRKMFIRQPLYGVLDIFHAVLVADLFICHWRFKELRTRIGQAPRDWYAAARSVYWLLLQDLWAAFLLVAMLCSVTRARHVLRAVRRKDAPYARAPGAAGKDGSGGAAPAPGAGEELGVGASEEPVVVVIGDHNHSPAPAPDGRATRTYVTSVADTYTFHEIVHEQAWFWVGDLAMSLVAVVGSLVFTRIYHIWVKGVWSMPANSDTDAQKRRDYVYKQPFLGLLDWGVVFLGAVAVVFAPWRVKFVFNKRPTLEERARYRYDDRSWRKRCAFHCGEMVVDWCAIVAYVFFHLTLVRLTPLRRALKRTRAEHEELADADQKERAEREMGTPASPNLGSSVADENSPVPPLRSTAEAHVYKPVYERGPAMDPFDWRLCVFAELPRWYSDVIPGLLVVLSLWAVWKWLYIFRLVFVPEKVAVPETDYGIKRYGYKDTQRRRLMYLLLPSTLWFTFTVVSAAVLAVLSVPFVWRSVPLAKGIAKRPRDWRHLARSAFMWVLLDIACFILCVCVLLSGFRIAPLFYYLAGTKRSLKLRRERQAEEGQATREIEQSSGTEDVGYAWKDDQKWRHLPAKGAYHMCIAYNFIQTIKDVPAMLAGLLAIVIPPFHRSYFVVKYAVSKVPDRTYVPATPLADASFEADLIEDERRDRLYKQPVYAVYDTFVLLLIIVMTLSWRVVDLWRSLKNGKWVNWRKSTLATLQDYVFDYFYLGKLLAIHLLFYRTPQAWKAIFYGIRVVVFGGKLPDPEFKFRKAVDIEFDKSIDQWYEIFFLVPKLLGLLVALPVFTLLDPILKRFYFDGDGNPYKSRCSFSLKIASNWGLIRQAKEKRGHFMQYGVFLLVVTFVLVSFVINVPAQLIELANLIMMQVCSLFAPLLFKQPESLYRDEEMPPRVFWHLEVWISALTFPVLLAANFAMLVAVPILVGALAQSENSFFSCITDASSVTGFSDCIFDKNLISGSAVFYTLLFWGIVWLSGVSLTFAARRKALQLYAPHMVFYIIFHEGVGAWKQYKKILIVTTKACNRMGIFGQLVLLVLGIVWALPPGILILIWSKYLVSWLVAIPLVLLLIYKEIKITNEHWDSNK